MEQNTTRKTLSERLQEAEVQYDISRMSIERDYHISQGYIFDQAIKEKKEELKKIHQPENISDEEMYKWTSLSLETLQAKLKM